MIYFVDFWDVTLLLTHGSPRRRQGEGEGAAAAAHAPRLHLVDGLAVIRRTGGVDPIQLPAVSSPSRPARRLPPGPLDSTAPDLAAWCSWVPRPVRKRLRRSSLKSFDFMLLLLIPTRIHPAPNSFDLDLQAAGGGCFA